jgi:FkbM family methyltransferase
MRYDLIMTEVLLKSSITKVTPKNVIEIGSRDGHDTEAMRKMFNVPEENCYIFEAHPDCFSYISKTYPKFNVFNCAITNQTRPISFNAGVVGIEDNIGMSSLLERGGFHSNKVTVDGWRFDEICTQLSLTSLDLVKIDVEGHTLEVLNGFGNMIQNTKVIQVEAEHIEVWEGQATYDKIKEFLSKKGFEEIAYMRHNWVQSDSLWINNNCINKN